MTCAASQKFVIPDASAIRDPKAGRSPFKVPALTQSAQARTPGFGRDDTACTRCTS